MSLNKVNLNRICIKFEDTLCDMNYSLINVLNSNQNRSDKLTYIEFEDSGYRILWDYPELYEFELDLKNESIFKAFEMLDLVALCKIKLLEMLKDYPNVEIYLITELDISFKPQIESFLYECGLLRYISHIEYSIDDDSIAEFIIYNNINVLIEDNPYLIKEVDFIDELVVLVRSHSYNENCYNLLRLECYSQLDVLIKRGLKKLEKIRNKTDLKTRNEDCKV